MTGCELGIGKSFDLGLCVKSMTVGWVPDWLIALAPYWPWLIVIGGLGLAYRVAGWPGVGAFLFGAGFLVGRRSKTVPHEPIEHLDQNDKDALRPPVSIKKRK